MAVKVIITKRLENKINKKFKKESIRIFRLLYSLKENPKKGKSIGSVRNVLIKELKYENYRFYFVTDGHRLKLYDKKEINDLLFRFIQISDKNNQQKVIDEIRKVLRGLGEEGF